MLEESSPEPNSTNIPPLAPLPAEQTATKIIRIARTADVIANVWELIKGVILAVIVIAVFWWLYITTHHQVPLYIPLLATISLTAGLVYNYFYWRNVAHADLTQSAYANQSSEPIVVNPDEKIIASLAAITPTFNRQQKLLNAGVSPVAHPENALIATQTAAYFIVVPLPANDIVVDGYDAQGYYWLLFRKMIQDKLDQMLANQSLQQIISSHPKNYAIPFSKIKRVHIIKFFGTFVITDDTGRKYRYTVRNPRKDFAVIRQVFGAFL